MKKLIVFMAACVAITICAGRAEPRQTTLSASTGTNDYATATDSTIAGYIDEIVIELPSGATTGVVSVTATPPVIGGAVTLASKTISATTTFRTRLDGTDTAASGLSSDPPGRYLAYGDLFTFSVTAASHTGKTWRCWVKWDGD